MSSYVPVLVHFALALLLAGTLMGLHMALGGRRPTLQKGLPYEAGVWPAGSAQERVPIRYYLVAMLFILFDVEIVFVYPWAVLVRQLGPTGIAEMFTFLGLLGVGYVYVWKRRALEWE
ncbi:MAG TPA: NADH-quinone oxidoreductase subunit A [bacterium]|nr:NADH-quinone oxidoreductase subunit A [bacterium]